MSNITYSNEPSLPKYFALRTFGGITLSDFQYTNEDLRIFSDHFYAGSSAGGGVAVDFYFKNQQWSVGLGWFDYAQRLEFEHTWQTEYVDPEGIISVEVDPESGDTLALGTGSVLVTASHNRHLRTYNHFNTLIVPFEWRKEFMISRWTLGCVAFSLAVSIKMNILLFAPGLLLVHTSHPLLELISSSRFFIINRCC